MHEYSYRVTFHVSQLELDVTSKPISVIRAYLHHSR